MLYPWALRLHRPPQLPKIERRLHTQPHKSARAQNLHCAQHLGRGQAQIQRRNNHSYLEAAVFQQNVIHRHRQERDQKVALRKTQAQQFARQGCGKAIELSPTHCARTIRAHHGGSVRPVLGPLRHHAVQQVAVRKIPFVVVEGELRYFRWIAHACQVDHQRRLAVNRGTCRVMGVPNSGHHGLTQFS